MQSWEISHCRFLGKVRYCSQGIKKTPRRKTAMTTTHAAPISVPPTLWKGRVASARALPPAICPARSCGPPIKNPILVRAIPKIKLAKPCHIVGSRSLDTACWCGSAAYVPDAHRQGRHHVRRSSSSPWNAAYIAPKCFKRRGGWSSRRSAAPVRFARHAPRTPCINTSQLYEALQVPSRCFVSSFVTPVCF